MKVVIPLAGKGTRLRPHTHVTPKPLLKVGDKPVMAYILDDLRDLGVRDAVIITGHLKEKVEQYMSTEYPDFEATYVEQPIQNGTAGAVDLARPHVQEDLLIIFVDTLFDADLSVARNLPEDVAGVIWVKEVEDYQRFGVVVADDEGFMQKIIEKPSEPISKRANIGLYYIRDWKLLFEGIEHVMKSPPAGGGEYYLTDAFQYMIDKGAKLKIIDVEGWYDAGKPETLLETNLHVLSGNRGRRPADKDGVKIVDPVHVADGVELSDCEIGPGVTLSKGVKVTGSTIRNSIIGEGSRIEGSNLQDSLVGSNAVVVGVQGQIDIGDNSVITAQKG